MQDQIHPQLEQLSQSSALKCDKDLLKKFVQCSKTIKVTDELIQKCLIPINAHFRTKIRVIVHIPHCTSDKISYFSGKKHLVVLNRLVYRTPRAFMDYIVNRFALPSQVKTEACFVLER